MFRLVVSPKSVVRLTLVVAAAALVAAGWTATVGPTWADDRHSYVVTDGDGRDVVFVGEGGSAFVLGADDEESAYLGVQLREETDHPEGGARVTEVVEDSPADRAGLREDDIIVEFDGHIVRGPAALTKRIHAREPGDQVGVKVLRNGKSERFDVELGSRSDAWAPYIGRFSVDVPEIAEDVYERLGRLGEGTWSLGTGCGDDDDCAFGYFDMALGRPKLGVQLVETTPELRRHLGGGEDRGVLVSKVLDDTPAERAGIEVGDLIIEVDGAEVGSTSDLRRALRDKVGETFDIQVIRGGTPRTVSVTISKPDDDRPTGPRAYVIRPGVRPRATVAPTPPRVPRVAMPVPRASQPAFPRVAPAPAVPLVVPAPRVAPAPPRSPAPPAPEASRVV